VNFNRSFSGFKTLWKIIVHSENCRFLGYFAAINGYSLPTFRDNLSIPFKCEERIGCTEASVRNYQNSLRNNAEERKILHFVDLHHAMILGKRPSCINTTSDNCHSVLVHTTRPPTQIGSYQRLYWYNLSLLMMSTRCSKHVESYK
jgi:hypothetical protein